MKITNQIKLPYIVGKAVLSLAPGTVVLLFNDKDVHMSTHIVVGGSIDNGRKALVNLGTGTCWAPSSFSYHLFRVVEDVELILK